MLGTIDVDACGNAAQVHKPPTVFYGQGTPGDEDDGMFAQWHTIGNGKIYINPTWGERPPNPKARVPALPCFYPLSQWVLKMHIEAQRGASVFYVGPAGTGRGWFQQYIAQCGAFCLLGDRIKFRLPDMPPEQKSQPGNDHMTALFSKNTEEITRFCDLMDPLGVVIEPA